MDTVNAREDFFNFISDFAKNFKDKIESNEQIASLDEMFQFKISNRVEDFRNIYSVNVSSENEPLFIFEITQYNKEKFISTLTYGFAFDQDVKDRINNKKFSCLLGEKKAYANDWDTEAYGIVLSIGKHAITDENIIINVFNEIKLTELMEDIYYKTNSQDSVNFNNLENENDSIENSLIKRIQKIKNKI